MQELHEETMRVQDESSRLEREPAPRVLLLTLLTPAPCDPTRF